MIGGQGEDALDVEHAERGVPAGAGPAGLVERCHPFEGGQARASEPNDRIRERLALPDLGGSGLDPAPFGRVRVTEVEQPLLEDVLLDGHEVQDDLLGGPRIGRDCRPFRGQRRATDAGRRGHEASGQAGPPISCAGPGWVTISASHGPQRRWQPGQGLLQVSRWAWSFSSRTCRAAALTSARKAGSLLALAVSCDGHRDRRIDRLRDDHLAACRDEVDRPSCRRDGLDGGRRPQVVRHHDPGEPELLRAGGCRSRSARTRPGSSGRSSCRWPGRPSRSARGRRSRSGTRPGTGSLEVVLRSTTPATSSVLPVTRPRPGKCFATVRMPAADMPSTKAAACAATAAGLWPYSRSRAPIGAFVLSVPGGTTSVTGAKSRLIPAFFSWVPQVRASACRVAGVIEPWARALGIRLKPGPGQGLDEAALLVRSDEQADARIAGARAPEPSGRQPAPGPHRRPTGSRRRPACDFSVNQTDPT